MSVKPYSFVVQLLINEPGIAFVVTADRGVFRFSPIALRFGVRETHLEGHATVEPAVPSTALDTCVDDDSRTRYHDFSAICTGPGDVATIAYVTYTGGKDPVVRIDAEPDEFGFLEQSECNDRLMVISVNGSAVGTPVPVTKPGLDLFRPSIAVDGNRRTAVVWSQNTGDSWNLYAGVRQVSGVEKTGGFSPPVRLTNGHGPDI